MRPSYEFYSGEHRGRLGPDAFADALPLACARLEGMVGPLEDGDPRAERWMHAACALVDRASGADDGGTLASESVGSTSVSYSQACQRGPEEADFASVWPWLAGTGLLCTAVL